MEDPLGVFDDYSQEQRESLKENMYVPVLDVLTQWRDGQVRWECHECGEDTYTEKFYGTKRCEFCMKIMQSENWEVGEPSINPEEEKSTQASALSW